MIDKIQTIFVDKDSNSILLDEEFAFQFALNIGDIIHLPSYAKMNSDGKVCDKITKPYEIVSFNYEVYNLWYEQKLDNFRNQPTHKYLATKARNTYTVIEVEKP